MVLSGGEEVSQIIFLNVHWNLEKNIQTISTRVLKVCLLVCQTKAIPHKCIKKV